jgi:hypothetical protein
MGISGGYYLIAQDLSGFLSSLLELLLELDQDGVYSGRESDGRQEEEEEEDIYADSESLLGQLISSAMPNSRRSASRLTRATPAQRVVANQAAQLLNESGPGSDDSCCSADNADILEACIASAMPSKSAKSSSSSTGLADQAPKLPPPRLSLGTLDY